MEFEFEDEPKSSDRSNQMSQESPHISNLVDTTDCLEAISVIRCWKNLLFILILISLLLAQVSFWLVCLKKVRIIEPSASLVTVPPAAEGALPAVQKPGPVPASGKIKQAAKEITAEPNSAAQADKQAAAEPNQPKQVHIEITFEPKIQHITALVRFLNFILIPSSIIYCLTMLFSVKLSLIGRLGGINHIVRAFFLSLLFVVLLLPWQLLFAPVFAGAMFTPSELINACQTQKTPLIYTSMLLRFCLYWLLVVMLLLLAQIRSMRWARATLRRLEVV
jgi:hypothetical protein